MKSNFRHYNTDGATALHWAASSGEIAAAEFLLGEVVEVLNTC